MVKLVNKLYLFYILYIMFNVYTKFEEHQVAMESSQNEIPPIEKRIAKVKKQKSLLKSYMKDIEKKKKEIEEVALQVEKLQKQLPARISDSDNLGYIRSLAENLRFKNIILKPGKSINNGFYITKRYILEGQTTYLQFLLFLERVAASEQILNVRGVKLERGPSTKSKRYEILKVSANIEAYKYNENHKEDRGIEGIEKEVAKKLEAEKAKKKPRRRRRKKR